MPSDHRFRKAVVTTLAKRAASRCSNPDCGALTSGPTDDPSGSINVGEAAHIYGALPGSARYDAAMNASDRSDITNAIWLCGNCHKMVDDDPNRYPVGLLFEWQREHERRVADQIGKAGAEIRHRYETRHLEEFGRLSYLAERLIIEKGDLWEYRLTAEVLRYETTPILQRWHALKRGLYMKQTQLIKKMEALAWLMNRMDEVQNITNGFDELINIEFARAWGEPGIPGGDKEIVSVCRLFSEMCESALEWEETVRFSEVEEPFDEVNTLFRGVAGGMIDEVAKLPAFFTEKLEQPGAGVHRLSLTLDMPDGWEDAIGSALKSARRRFLSELSQ